MVDARSLYGRLPVPLRSAAATAHGFRLRWWRYPRRSEQLVRDALERDRWSTEQWCSWQEGRLESVLALARSAPHYSESLALGGGAPAGLADWPLLEKQTVRNAPERLVVPSADRRLYRDQTSGTTGTPLVVFLSRDAVVLQYALFEARVRRWNGVSRHDRWAMLGGQMVVPVERDRPPFWVRNRGLNQLYMSTVHLGPATVADYAAALRAFGPRHLMAYPSSLSVLARLALERGIELPQLRVALSNAEPLSPEQRDVIGTAFGCPVRDTYGMGEAAIGASECEAGHLHVWPDSGVLEVLDELGQPVPDGTVGEIVVTGLVNTSMPLVRYRTGDRGAIAWDDPCECGRSMPTLTSIEGRMADAVTTPDGRVVFWLNPALYGAPVVEAQMIQDRVDHMVVRVVPDRGWDASAAATIRERLVSRLGPEMDIEVVEATKIERGPNGKFRAVISMVTENGAVDG